MAKGKQAAGGKGKGGGGGGESFFCDCITFVKITFVSNLNTSTIIPLLDKEKKDDGKLKPAQSVKVTMSRDRGDNVQGD